MYNYNKNENLDSVAKSNINFSRLALLFISLFVSCAIMYYVVSPMCKESKIIKIGNEIKEESVENNKLSLIKIIEANNESKEFIPQIISEDLIGLLDNYYVKKKHLKVLKPLSGV